MKKTASLLVMMLLFTTPALLAQARTGSAGVAGGAPLASGMTRGASGAAHIPGFRTGRVQPGVVGGFFRHGRRFHNRFFSPFWSSAFWWDEDGYPEERAVEVERVAPAVPSTTTSPLVDSVKPANPLLIELQGDRFVRLGVDAQTAAVSSRAVAPAAGQSTELTPAVLVFRDGHRQEVSSYAVIGPALYASGSYWTTGYWTQKILLANLDLSATVRANQERGVNFVLPSAPNQVITRP